MEKVSNPYIAYHLSFPAPEHHEVEVQARIPVEPACATEVFMPVWTPGSYLIREYAQHLVSLRATDALGQPLTCTKVQKNRWRLDPTASGAVILHYTLYARELSVRTNWIDPDFALLNGAATFITSNQLMALPHAVTVALPPCWARAISALPAHPDGAAGHFLAANYDALVDAPWLLGSPALQTFEAAGRPHLLATVGDMGLFDGGRASADLSRLVSTVARLWGEVPYAHYTFMNLLGDGRGGLEHADCSVLMAPREASRSASTYLEWLSLAAHEHFHSWNIKRLRPLALGPFDYEREAPTPSLWIAEGITAYYDDLLVHRAGFCDQQTYLSRLSRNIEQLQETPGRRLQSLSAASFDAWIKFYRRDENSDNVCVSYYTKGAVVAFLLDAALRQGSGGRSSLDSVMRAAYRDYAGARGYSEADFRALIERVSGLPLAAWLAAAVDGTEELDYGPALAAYGLQFAPLPPLGAEVPLWLGLTTRLEGGRVLVAQVRRGGPAHQAGLQVEDELIALDGWRLLTARWSERLRGLPPDHSITLQICRRQRLHALPIKPQKMPARSWQLMSIAEPTAAQLATRQAWLAG